MSIAQRSLDNAG